MLQSISKESFQIQNNNNNGFYSSLLITPIEIDLNKTIQAYKNVWTVFSAWLVNTSYHIQICTDLVIFIKDLLDPLMRM